METAFEPTLQNILDNNDLRWIFVGGKGGVGKTTTSSSLAVLLSQHRSNVLIISTDPAHNLSDCFDQKFNAEPSQVNGFTNLFAMEVEPTVDANKFKLNLPGSVDTIEADKATQSLLSEIMSSVPGIDEAMSFAEMIKTVEQKNFDVVVFDTAPTGHTLRLLNFPDILDRGLQKLLSMKEKFVGIFAQFAALLGGQEAVDQMFETMFGNIEKMKKNVEKVNEQMKDQTKTTFLAVMIPEFLSLYETERLVQELMKSKIDIHNVVVNQVLFPDDKCRMCIARSKMQKKYLDQVMELYDDFHIVVIPLQEEEVRGVPKLKSFCTNLLTTRKVPQIPEHQIFVCIIKGKMPQYSSQVPQLYRV
eukprot:TRINITY_DN5362_c0_g1_i2.p1 TRINITY_DN5362_c0_g1~~TRINITY_DN5362_c0_g1_i2.p1  ORF type:complete len:360 (-),score=72.91 TRINITY_DN5362_c0_g1_i2:10-1089(-)